MAVSERLWTASPSFTSIVTLSSALDGDTDISAAVVNKTAASEKDGLVLTLETASFTAAVDGYLAVYILYTDDAGTTYEMGSAGSPGTIPTKAPIHVFLFSSTAQAYLLMSPVLEVLPFDFKILTRNEAGAAIPAAGTNEIKYAFVTKEQQ